MIVSGVADSYRHLGNWVAGNHDVTSVHFLPFTDHRRTYTLVTVRCY